MLKGGLKSSLRAGVFGGVLLALIEGAAHILQKGMEQKAAVRFSLLVFEFI